MKSCRGDDVLSGSTPRFDIESDSLHSADIAETGSISEDPADPKRETRNCVKWVQAWTHHLPGAPIQVNFSPNGRFFATLHEDRLSSSNSLRVWFREPAPLPLTSGPPNDNSSQVVFDEPTNSNERWEYLPLPHPCPIIYFSWRQCSRYLPPGWIPSVLITSSRDGVCRIWIETTKQQLNSVVGYTDGWLGPNAKQDKGTTRWAFPPSENLPTISFPFYSALFGSKPETSTASAPSLLASSQVTFPLPPLLITHPILRRFLDLWLSDPFADVEVNLEPISQKSEPFDFHSCNLNELMYPRFSFVTSLCFEGLGCSESGELSKSTAGQFVIHWLNNKIYRFDERVREILKDTISRILATPLPMGGDENRAESSLSPPDLIDQLALIDQSFAVLIGEWQHAPDVVFAIHPIDGSLIVWYVHGLDTSVPNPSGIQTHYVQITEQFTHRIAFESAFTATPNFGSRLTQVTASLRSRLHDAFPVGQAASTMPKISTFMTRTAGDLYSLCVLQTPPTSFHFVYRDACLLFCRILVLRNTFQFITSSSGPKAEKSLLLSQHEDNQAWVKAFLAELAEAQLLYASFDPKQRESEYIALLTRHANGSLRHWRLDVSRSSHFQWILSVSPIARLSGHRFHTEAIIPHPLLPLILTTSHHICSLPDLSKDVQFAAEDKLKLSEIRSEVILWRVASVGPLTGSAASVGIHMIHCPHSKTEPGSQIPITPLHMQHGGTSEYGGLFEVARIDVRKIGRSLAWFTDLAWFPCLMSVSMAPYPIGLFVGGMSHSEDTSGELGIFLTLPDAGSKLSQALLKMSQKSATGETGAANRFVSLASSDTTGCMLQLQTKLPLSKRAVPSFLSNENLTEKDAETFLIHVFPSELIQGTKTGCAAFPTDMRVSILSYSTYLIVRLTRWRSRHTGSARMQDGDKTKGPSFRQLEMWQIHVITEADFPQGWEEHLVGEADLSLFDELVFDALKVCDCQLPVPPNVSVVRADLSAAHVSWAALSTYNAPPLFHIVTACTDGCLRFWRCSRNPPVDAGKTRFDAVSADPACNLFTWSEWQMPLTHAMCSCIRLEGDRPPLVLDVDCAYSGRVAVAYAPYSEDGFTYGVYESNLRIPKVLVAIYECESSGGCEWILEDIIDLTSEVYIHFRHNRSPATVQLDWVSTEDGGHLLSVRVGCRISVYAATSENLTANGLKDLHTHLSSTLMTSLGEVYLSWKRVGALYILTPDSWLPVKPKTDKFETCSVRPASSRRHRRAVWMRNGTLLVGLDTELQVYCQWPSESPAARMQMQGVLTMDAQEEVYSSQVAKDSSALDLRQSNSTKIEQITVPKEATVAGSASMAVARLTETYSAYLLRKSASSALLGASGTTGPSLEPAFPNFSVPNDNFTVGNKQNSHSLVGGILDPTLLSNLGLFEALQLFNPVLPQFHPRQLLEWMNLGRLRRVQAILAHLTQCLTKLKPIAPYPRGLDTSAPIGIHNRRSVQYSPGSEPSAFEDKTVRRLSVSASNALQNVDNSIILEAPDVPPLPLYILLAVDSLQCTDDENIGDEDAVFDPSNDFLDYMQEDEPELLKISEDSEESSLGSGTLGSRRPRRKSNDLSDPGFRRHSRSPMNMYSLKPSSISTLARFTQEDAKILAEYLTTRQLPGLSSLDQMYLLGIADLMADKQLNFTERFSSMKFNARAQTDADGSKPTSDDKQETQQSQGLDECGLRFLLTLHLYSYLSRTLPPAKRVQLLSSGLTSSCLVWAFHSEAEGELLSRLPACQFSGSEELTWDEFRRYGCVWWIRSDTLLRQCIEKIARFSFQSTKDPMESVVFYLAMRKAKVVAGLFKTIGNKKLENFFRLDFESGQPPCRQAKLNAFRLLSQHKYAQAAGLFLLAGCLDDAVRVCLDTIKDLQLALVIARLYSSSIPGSDSHSPSSPYFQLLRQHVITNEDPFLRSMGYWILGDRLAALQTLLEKPEVHDHSSNPSSPQTAVASATSVTLGPASPQRPQSMFRTNSVAGADETIAATATVYPSVFKFYTFLRSHPLVIRQWKLISSDPANFRALQRLSSLERRLYFRTAHHYSALGCPTLALEVLTKLPTFIPTEQAFTASSMDEVTSESNLQDSMATMIQGVSTTTVKTNASEIKLDDDIFNWSAEDNLTSANDQLKLDWSDEEGTKTASPTTKPASSTARTSLAPTSGAGDDGLFTQEDKGAVDLIANQLKFIACLKILSEEMSTLVPIAELSKRESGIRDHVWHWLEHELAVVNSITASPKEFATSDNQESPSSPKLLLESLIRLHKSDSDAMTTGMLPLSSSNRGPLTSPSLLLSTSLSPINADKTQSVMTTPYGFSSRRPISDEAVAAIILSGPTLTPEIMDAERKRLRVRREWLKAHKAFLTSLINFCDLYGASCITIPVVRMELLLLLTELYTYPTHTSLVSCIRQTGTEPGGRDQPKLRPVASRSTIAPLPPIPPQEITQDSVVTPTSIIGLIGGIPFLRDLLYLPPGAFLLPTPSGHLQRIIEDLMACLETLPPPYLTTAILPYLHEPKVGGPGSGTSGTGHNSADASSPYCAKCAWYLTPPRQRRIYLLRNLCATLAFTLHQCLSVGGWLWPGSGHTSRIALPASDLLNARSVERQLSTGQSLKPNTEPSRWPGLTSLRKYIRTQHSEPSSKAISGSSAESYLLQTAIHPINRQFIIGILAQALAGTYLGLLVYCMHVRDASALYRLAAVKLNSTTWNKVFGGTYRAKPSRPAPPPAVRSSHSPSPAAGVGKPLRPQRPGTSPVSDANKQDGSTSEAPPPRPRPLRVEFSIPGPSDEAKNEPRFPVGSGERGDLSGLPSSQRQLPPAPTSSMAPPPPPDEWFVPPECSMLTCLLERPSKAGALADDPSEVFDSDDTEPPEDYDSYAQALTKHQNQIRRVRRRLQHQRTLHAKLDAQQKAKDALRRRIAKRTGKMDSSDEEAEAAAVTPYESAEEEQKTSDANKIAEEIKTQPHWILKRLHLDPDFGNAWFGTASELDGEDILDAVRLSGTYPPDANFRDESEEEDNDSELDSGRLHSGEEQIKLCRAELQWASGDSYSWRLMRLGLMQLAKNEIDRLIQLLDFGPDDLAVYAPGLVTATRLVNFWMTGYRLELTTPPTFTPRTLAHGPSSIPESQLLPPPHFLPGIEQDLNPEKTVGLHLEPKISLDVTESPGQLPSAGATRAMLRLRHLIDPTRTPFQTRDPFSLPVKRLWCYLVRQPKVDDVFLRHIFRKPRLVQSLVVPSSEPTKPILPDSPDSAAAPLLSGTAVTTGKSSGGSDEGIKHGTAGTGKLTRHHHANQPATVVSSNSLLLDEAIRLIHKEQEPLIAMCINQANHSCIAVATPKEVIELNIDNLVALPAWYADEVEYDLELMRRPQARFCREGGTDDFVILDSDANVVGGDRAPSSSVTVSTQPGTGANVMMKRNLPAVYSLAAHPSLPYYLSGTGTGSVHLFEWATTLPVVASFTNTYSLTPAGATGSGPAGSRGARVTALHFDDSGRRFGCGDADGNFGLWNVQYSNPDKPPYFRCRCHAKSLADFCFVGSSTLIATVGNGGGGVISGVSVNATGSAYGANTSSPRADSSGSGGSSAFGIEQDASNLTLWDTLLPPRRCGVIRVTDPELESPCTSVAHLSSSININGWPSFSANNRSIFGNCLTGGCKPGLGARDRIVVVGTKRGDVCFVDLRQPRVLLGFSAHDSAVRSLCVDPAADCLITGGADGNVKVWRMSEHELITSFCADFHQGRGAAAVAAAALFRGNQSAAIIAATNPGIANIQLLPTVTGASLLCHGSASSDRGNEIESVGFAYDQYQQQKHSVAAASTACRFVSCGADGGLRMRSFVMRPRPFSVC
ncbi:unnamed protein product [Calicophoron daubneyi]|uniref:RAVE complex protein Rav1 C-terminal domain-containing protein n=1 Tax=Calicophoron daubneyi TaxID=300641 RepID=A0AAV2T3B8_CALDB